VLKNTGVALRKSGIHLGRVPMCSPVVTPPLLLFAAAEEWHKMGGEPWQLIEPVDGFHPSQVKTQPREMGGSRQDAGACCCPRHPVGPLQGCESGGFLFEKRRWL